MIRILILFVALAMFSASAWAREASFASFDRRAREGDALSVVFFGGSLTWGANASDPNLTSYRGRMCSYLRDRYPKARFTFHDAAIGGTGSNLGAFRMERDVLSRKPDLVFLDFMANDGIWDTEPVPTCFYEHIVRTLVGAGIPVAQMEFVFRFNLEGKDGPAESGLDRRALYRKLAAAYGLPEADLAPFLLERLRAGTTTLDAVWPKDGAHPYDEGYALFFECAKAAFEKAVSEEFVCRAPEAPVFGTVSDLRRTRLHERPLPNGWRKDFTYRTALWFDGLSSRWMDAVAVAGGESPEPFRIDAPCTFVGVFGEADAHARAFRIDVDGRPAATFEAKHGCGDGQLFIWRHAVVPEGSSVSIVPLAGEGELHIDSLCTATIRVAEPPSASSK